MIDPMHGHALYVPSGEEVCAVLHSELPIDGPAYLRAKSRMEVGAVATFPINVDDKPECVLHFLVGTKDSPLPANERARAILVYLTTLHMEITGPAIFIGLTHEKVHDIFSSVL